MKKTAFAVILLTGTLALAGCADTPRDNAAARGGLLGAATGALIGAAATGRASGALAGAAVGGAAGAIVGSSTVNSERYSERRRRCARVGYDYSGNRICREYYYD